MKTSILQWYGVIGSMRLLRDVLVTKLLYPGARIIRSPAYLRGASHIRWGANFTTGVGLRLDAFPASDRVVIEIGNDVQINDYVHIAAIDRVAIGDETLIASKVFISDHNHGEYRLKDPASAADVAPAQRPLIGRPVEIGRRVWIGEHVCIMPGVRIGDGAVIGAGSIVTQDVPGNCVVVGAPARVVRRFDPVEQAWLDVRDQSTRAS